MIVVEHRGNELKVSVCGVGRYVVKQNDKIIIGPVINHILAEKLLEAYSLKRNATYHEDFDNFNQDKTCQDNCNGCIYWRDERGCRFGELYLSSAN